LPAARYALETIDVEYFVSRSHNEITLVESQAALAAFCSKQSEKGM